MHIREKKMTELSDYQRMVEKPRNKQYEETIATLRARIVELEGDAAERPGTSAYTMLAAAEQANVETTETMIQMIAATVLAAVLDNGVGGPFRQDNGSWAVSFSPADVDAMYRAYDMSAKREGMLTTVSIMERAVAETHQPTSLYVQAGDTDAEPVKPQAEVVAYDRPLWAIRYYSNDGGVYLALMHDQADAMRHLPDYVGRYDQPEPTIENRWCLHPDCPTTGCTHTEATSES
jgi:hypothetical protein